MTARDRMIETALNLFYKQGYLATGINQIIAESRVAKATFYAHFASKEALCIAYLQARHRLWMSWLADSITSHADPKARLLGIFSFLKQWMQDSGFRGCAFLNIAAEVPFADSQIRSEVIKHKDQLQQYIREIIAEIISSNHARLDFETDDLADAVYVLIEGAIVASQNYSAVWPIEAAQKAVEKYLGG